MVGTLHKRLELSVLMVFYSQENPPEWLGWAGSSYWWASSLIPDSSTPVAAYTHSHLGGTKPCMCQGQRVEERVNHKKGQEVRVVFIICQAPGKSFEIALSTTVRLSWKGSTWPAITSWNIPSLVFSICLRVKYICAAGMFSIPLEHLGELKSLCG